MQIALNYKGIRKHNCGVKLFQYLLRPHTVHITCSAIRKVLHLMNILILEFNDTPNNYSNYFWHSLQISISHMKY